MRWSTLVLVCGLALALSGPSEAATPHKKRHTHWHGYGFLPGYRPPEAIAWERAHQREPIVYWNATPGYYRGRWNGGGFGPCWERTPIGPMWTCGR